MGPRALLGLVCALVSLAGCDLGPEGDRPASHAEGERRALKRNELRERALQLAAALRFTEALPLLESLAASEPDDPVVVQALTEAEARTGRIDEAAPSGRQTGGELTFDP